MQRRSVGQSTVGSGARSTTRSGGRPTRVGSAGSTRFALVAGWLALALLCLPVGGPPGVATAGAATTGAAAVERVPGGPTGTYVVPAGIHKVRHVIVVMQENRSFDTYFGTFPGADGIPMANGTPTACAPDPVHGGCVRPFHDTADVDGGGPHGHASAVADINGGKMDGFVAQREASLKNCTTFADPACSTTTSQPDVMGYHDQQEIPNYWTYAKDFVLDDHMF